MGLRLFCSCSFMSSFSTVIDKQDSRCFYFIFILVPQYITCMKMKYGCLITKVCDKRQELDLS